MNEKKFIAYKQAAKHMGGDYGAGYQLGISRHYYGERFEVKHDAYMSMTGARQELGDGYRDGFAGAPPRGTHANVGNGHAAYEMPPDSQMQIRLPQRLKARYVKQAQLEGKTLSQWVLEKCSAACTVDE